MSTKDQLLLDFKFEKNYLNYDYYLSSSNKVAYNQIISWPKWFKKTINLYGEKFSGKSHLASIFEKKSTCIKVFSKEFSDETIQNFKTKQALIIEDLNEKFSENLLTMITGVLIFYPVCFVSNPVHAIIMGVTMHYSQYLFLTNKVFNKRASENGIKKKNLFNNFWFTIIVYSTIMSILSIFGKHDSDTLKNILIIPIIGQMLHFYLDSQLWKFSVSHNRENILKHLKNT